jgi:hypothetical protein
MKIQILTKMSLHPAMKLRLEMTFQRLAMTAETVLVVAVGEKPKLKPYDAHLRVF